MDYNGPIWVHGCHPRKERQRFIRIFPMPSHPLLSSNTAVQVYTLLFCACVYFSWWSEHHVLWYTVQLYKCTYCHAQIVLCCALCSVHHGLAWSDQMLLCHTCLLWTPRKVWPKWGSFSPLQLSPPTTIVIVFEIWFSQSLADKLAASQLDANAVTSFWAECEFHLDIMWPSSEVSSESSTPVMSS